MSRAAQVLIDTATRERRDATSRIQDLLTEYRRLATVVGECDAVLAVLGVSEVQPEPEVAEVELPTYERTEAPVAVRLAR